jgi:hydroxypyruvate reductase
MAAGASIHEINALRSNLSAIKGGKLAAICPTPITTLVISDVFDDDPRIVGSGPTIDGRGETDVIAPMSLFADAFARELGLPRADAPLVADVATVELEPNIVAWGEPTVRLPPDHGTGGRAQQLALLLAKQLHRTDRAAFVAGSDGVDGPPPAPAGAFVDGTTWGALLAASIDPDLALARCDAGTALRAVGALFTPGPTGINHADIAILG